MPNLDKDPLQTQANWEVVNEGGHEKPKPEAKDLAAGLSPVDAFGHENLGHHILDLSEAYQKTGDEELLDIIKRYSKHIGVSVRTIQQRAARRKKSKDLTQANIFNKIPQRKAQDVTAEQEPITIPTGNAQLVYGIEGKPGEQFEVSSEGTMLPVGKYVVVNQDEGNWGNMPWGNFSNLVVKRMDAINRDDDSDYDGEPRTGQMALPAQSPPAQVNYTPDLQQQQMPPSKPTVPPPPGKKYVLDKSTNTWVAVPIDQTVQAA